MSLSIVDTLSGRLLLEKNTNFYLEVVVLMMKIPTSLEVDAEGNCLAFAFDFPGACGWGNSKEAAFSKLREDIYWVIDWLTRHKRYDRKFNEFQLDVIETIEATGKPLIADTEGFFKYDQYSLTNEDIIQTIEYLKFSREDLYGLINIQSIEQDIDLKKIELNQNIHEIINHIAIAEWWYMTRLSVINVVTRFKNLMMSVI